MFLIVINQGILESIGMSPDQISDLRNHGLQGGVCVASCFSFDAAGECDASGVGQAQRLASVAEADPKERSLLLVGVADRYGAAERFAGWVRQIGIHTSGVGWAPLTEIERDRLSQCLWGVHGVAIGALRAALNAVSRTENAAARSIRTRGRRTIVVTRHKCLVQYLQEIGHVGPDVTVIEHATEQAVTGQHVIGILPIRLAALCATYAECSLVLEEQDRGIPDLPIERIRQIAQPLTEYRVRRVGLVGDL